MKYAFTIYRDESQMETATPEQMQEMSGAYREVTEEMQQKGVLLAGDGLYPTATATTIRVRDGQRDVTDGPFAETKEQLGGFYVLDCRDLDEAIEWASKIPTAVSGCAEVPPAIQYDYTASSGRNPDERSPP